jgi:hypothetical protein
LRNSFGVGRTLRRQTFETAIIEHYRRFSAVASCAAVSACAAFSSPAENDRHLGIGWVNCASR